MPTNSAQKSSWKSAQHGKKVKQKTKLAVLVIIIIILLTFLSQVFQVAKSLFQPTSSDLPKKEYSWDGTSNINLALKDDAITVLSYNPHESSVVLVEIPQQTSLTVTGGLGIWQLRAIYDLGGSATLRSSLSLFLGLPIDGFVEVDDINKLTHSDPGQIVSSISSLKTDLTPLEITRLLWGLGGVRFDKVQTFDLLKENILQKSSLADGTEVLVADPAQIDAISVKFVESKIVSERYSIAIFNTTQKPGVAGKAARLITNMGGDVIVTTSSSTQLKKSFVYTNEKDLKNSYTYSRLKNIFGEFKEESDCQNNPNCSIIPAEVKDSRAQINVVLGEDFLKRLE